MFLVMRLIRDEVSTTAGPVKLGDDIAGLMIVYRTREDAERDWPNCEIVELTTRPVSAKYSLECMGNFKKRR